MLAQEKYIAAHAIKVSTYVSDADTDLFNAITSTEGKPVAELKRLARIGLAYEKAVREGRVQPDDAILHSWTPLKAGKKKQQDTTPTT